MPTSDDKARWFETTHWSVVLAATDPNPSNEALEQLCRTYWQPLYHFIRATGRTIEEAEDLTQGFFTELLATGKLRVADQAKGRFRSFLLVCLKNFISGERQKAYAIKRGGGATLLSIDVDLPDGVATPPLDLERAYDREWAMTALSEAQRLLREEHAACDRADYLQALVPSMFLGEAKCSYAKLAARFNKREDAIRQDVSRIRKRFRTLLQKVVSTTVADHRDISSELRYLCSIVDPTCSPSSISKELIKKPVHAK